MGNKERISGFRNGNGKGALLTRLAVELTRLAQGRDPKLDYLLEQLRHSLHESAPSSDFKNSAARFLKYIVSGHVEFASGFEQSIQKTAIDLFTAIESCFPGVSQITSMKEDLLQVASLQETVEQVEKLIPVLAGIGERESGAFADFESGREGELCAGFPASVQGEFSLAQMLDIIAPVLNQLLDQLNLIEPGDDRVDRVRSDLVRIASMDELETVFGETLHLVVDVARQIDKEREYTEEFLTHLRLHLKSLEEGINESVDFETTLKNADKIQVAVGNEIEGIESAVDENVDLDVLKQIVRTRVERLSSRVSDYIASEKQQLEVAKGKVDELTRQTQIMNKEVEGLRHQLIEKQQVMAVDPLTGVANRGGFDKRIEEELARSLRIGFPLSLLVVDIDKFKFVNDTFGHSAGDKVLQTIAKLMSSRLRDTDFIARYGGDEFVILLAGTSDDDAKTVAQGFCDAVRRCGFHSQGRSVDVTLSIGVAQLQEGDTSETFFERADTAMYKAKDKGRDGCAVALLP